MRKLSKSTALMSLLGSSVNKMKRKVILAIVMMVLIAFSFTIPVSASVSTPSNYVRVITGDLTELLPTGNYTKVFETQILTGRCPAVQNVYDVTEAWLCVPSAGTFQQNFREGRYLYVFRKAQGEQFLEDKVASSYFGTDPLVFQPSFSSNPPVYYVFYSSGQYVGSFEASTATQYVTINSVQYRLIPSRMLPIWSETSYVPESGQIYCTKNATATQWIAVYPAARNVARIEIWRANGQNLTIAADHITNQERAALQNQFLNDFSIKLPAPKYGDIELEIVQNIIVPAFGVFENGPLAYVIGVFLAMAVVSAIVAALVNSQHNYV